MIRTILSFLIDAKSQISPEDRLVVLLLLDLLIKTAVQEDNPSSENKNELLQLEILATGLPKLDDRTVRRLSSYPDKPRWIKSDLTWFYVLSMKSLFHEDEFLHKLSDLMINDEQRWMKFCSSPAADLSSEKKDFNLSEVEQLIVVRLLRPDLFVATVHRYLIERFSLDKLVVRQGKSRAVEIQNLPSKCVDQRRIPFERSLIEEKIDGLIEASKVPCRTIDCRSLDSLSSVELSEQLDLIYLKNVDDERLFKSIDSIRSWFRCLTSLLNLSLVFSFRINQIKHPDHEGRKLSVTVSRRPLTPGRSFRKRQSADQSTDLSRRRETVDRTDLFSSRCDSSTTRPSIGERPSKHLSRIRSMSRTVDRCLREKFVSFVESSARPDREFRLVGDRSDRGESRSTRLISSAQRELVRLFDSGIDLARSVVLSFVELQVRLDPTERVRL